MRDEKEIQLAHDILVQILLGEVPSPFDDDKYRDALNAAASTLCWVLKHEHNSTFKDNLDKIIKYLAELGYTVTDLGQPISRLTRQ